MKKTVWTVLGAVALLGLSGCATKDYVKAEVDPLADRLGKLEARVNAIEGKVTQLGNMTDADKADIKQANDKAQQALDVANKLMGDVKKSDDNMAKAEAAAMRAEKAAAAAEQAAAESRKSEKKSEKIFKLEQKK